VPRRAPPGLPESRGARPHTPTRSSTPPDAHPRQLGRPGRRGGWRLLTGRPRTRALLSRQKSLPLPSCNQQVSTPFNQVSSSLLLKPTSVHLYPLLLSGLLLSGSRDTRRSRVPWSPRRAMVARAEPTRAGWRRRRPDPRLLLLLLRLRLRLRHAPFRPLLRDARLLGAPRTPPRPTHTRPRPRGGRTAHEGRRGRGGSESAV
jgi:hypothetical protein